MKQKPTIHALRNNAMPDETMRDVKMALRGYHEGAGDARLLEREQIARMVDTALKEHLNELAELERVANATRSGSELAVYKTALDDVRSMIARRRWANGNNP